MDLGTVSHVALALALVAVSVPLGPASVAEPASAEPCDPRDDPQTYLDCLTCGGLDQWVHVHPDNHPEEGIVHLHSPPCPT